MATRLAKADQFAAIVVAAVALERLGLVDHLTEVLPTSLFVPQVGQGALAVECRADDGETRRAAGAGSSTGRVVARSTPSGRS